jgi:hypothetical protein
VDPRRMRSMGDWGFGTLLHGAWGVVRCHADGEAPVVVVVGGVDRGAP